MGGAAGTGEGLGSTGATTAAGGGSGSGACNGSASVDSDSTAAADAAAAGGRSSCARSAIARTASDSSGGCSRVSVLEREAHSSAPADSTTLASGAGTGSNTADAGSSSVSATLGSASTGGKLCPGVAASESAADRADRGNSTSAGGDAVSSGAGSGETSILGSSTGGSAAGMGAGMVSSGAARVAVASTGGGWLGAESAVGWRRASSKKRVRSPALAGAVGLFLAAMLIRLAAGDFACDASPPEDFAGTASGVAVGSAGASPFVEAAVSSGSGDRELGSMSKARSAIKGAPASQCLEAGARLGDPCRHLAPQVTIERSEKERLIADAELGSGEPEVLAARAVELHRDADGRVWVRLLWRLRRQVDGVFER